jgi:DNA-binding transcriptional ArsR family regulator
MTIQATQEFTKLRTLARQKRDRAIAHAHSEFEATMAQIAAIEQDLLGKESSRHHKISACIERSIPRDQTFTVSSILKALEAMDPARVWRRRSVEHHITRLREKGIVRRVQRSKMSQGAVYALADAKIGDDPVPFQQLTLREAVSQVLTRPMTSVEIALALLEAGYETAMDRIALRTAISATLRKSDKFKEEGGKWVAG